MVELEALANSNRIRLELLENALDIYTGTSLNKKISEASTNDERLQIIQEELIFIVQMWVANTKVGSHLKSHSAEMSWSERLFYFEREKELLEKSYSVWQLLVIEQILSLEKCMLPEIVMDDFLDVLSWFKSLWLPNTSFTNEESIVNLENSGAQPQIGLYREAVENLNAAACSKLGDLWMENGLFYGQDKAINWYSVGAALGDPNAQFHLANLYFVGEDVEEDLEHAFSLYKAAAEQGHLDAANNLADMYLNGEGTEVDESAAFKWFTYAASQGVVEAIFTLGLMYEQGLGVEKNIKEALKLYFLSAEGGYVVAQYRIGNIYFNGLLNQSLDYEVAIYWYELAAVQHHVDAQFDLGYMYVNGLGVDKDVKKGISWYKKASSAEVWSRTEY